MLLCSLYERPGLSDAPVNLLPLRAFLCRFNRTNTRANTATRIIERNHYNFRYSMRQAPDLLATNNSALDVQAKVAFVKACRAQNELSPLLRFGTYTISLQDRAIEPAAPPADAVIFSTYFSSHLDPQRNTFVDNNAYSYIQPLYESVHQLGLACIIFHDNLSPEFVAQYTTNKIRFVKTELGELSLNDERFLIYYEYILRYGQHIKWLLFSDVSDVVVQKNPFELLQQHPQRLLLGRSNLERMKHHYGNYLRVASFARDAQLEMPSAYFDMRIFNAGTIGGATDTLLYLMYQMIYFFKRCGTENNHNMTILNYCIYQNWLESAKCSPVSNLALRKKLLKIAMLVEQQFKIDLLPRSYHCTNETYQTPTLLAGYPFTSAFKQFEKDSTAYLVHK